ncbi:MAG: citrate lyase beta subunit [Frankiales bacterium]|nr:citrate lyase beta subunit [Frankiales bacterium]
MRHFDFLSDAEQARLFYRVPQSFDASAPINRLAVALGATLYSPATRPTLAADLAKRADEGVKSSVVCLEDAVADKDLIAAERNVIAQLRAYSANAQSNTLVFVRVRTAEQIPMLINGLGDHADVITGFVLPKFTAKRGPAFLEAVVEAADLTHRRILAMPVLESNDIMHAETRIDELMKVRCLLEQYRHLILALRIGATDLSAVYGLRRSRDLTVYDVRILADVIADVVNILGRAGDAGYTVTGPVWEYFSGSERLFKPQLRESPFVEHSERSLRAGIIAKDLDGLIREFVLDKANGLVGKTVIHPTHVGAVHALSVVTHEEYSDAVDILDRAGGGVRASSYRNKMNESKPHAAWANRIIDRANIFGVANETTSFVDLLGAGLQQ